MLEGPDIPFEGYMVAVAAAMEAPAILSALWLLSAGGGEKRMDGHLWREILLNGSIVLLVGAFAIGMITGKDGLAEIESFIVSPFKGALCLFLLDMGLVAGRGIRQSRGVINAETFVVWRTDATHRRVVWRWRRPVVGSVDGRGASSDGFGGVSVLYRRSCRNACCCA